ncbi:MAG: OsmC family protein [Myxococcaceae bacterium]|nr:OsmC family protein [Myxococcaceae bacterium]
MSDYRVTLRWEHTQGDFRRGEYLRTHSWAFDGGVVVPASPSPHVVRVPYSDPACVDPEEAFVASIASCHMLSFLYVAQLRGLDIKRYEDEAVGVLTKNERRVSWVSSVVLSPRITYVGERLPSARQAAELHEEAHNACFIANSVKTEIRVKVVEGLLA